MKRSNRNLTFLFALFALFITAVQAEDIYVAQTARGADTGLDANNAHSAAWFNTAANWATGTSKISPGDTVHLVGNISTALTVQGSGTAGNIITILFDPGATMSAPAWTKAGAIGASYKSYITIDGGATGTIGGYGASGTVNGYIECTANGTGLANQQYGATGVYLYQSSNIVVKNLGIYNLYVRNDTDTEPAYGASGSYGVFAAMRSGVSNVTMQNCIGYHMEIMFRWDSSGTGGSGIFMDRVTAHHINWGGGGGPYTSGDTFSNVIISNNYFYSFANWDDPSVNNYNHHNGYFAYANNGSTLTTVRYIGNRIAGPYTSGVGGNHATSALFIQSNVLDVAIWNNLILSTGGDVPSRFIYINPGAYVTSTYSVLYNTIIGSNKIGTAINADVNSSGSGVQTLRVIGNIVVDADMLLFAANSPTWSYSVDYNIGYNLGRGYCSSTGSSSGGTVDLATALLWWGWQAHGKNVNPLLVGSGDYTLQSGSPAIGAGVNLSSLFTTDSNGTSRASTNAWDIGAYTSGTVVASTLPPSNVKINLVLP